MTSATADFLLYLVLITCSRAAGKGGPEPFEVRLTGGTTTFEGLVEIYVDGYWTAICDDSMSFKTANVLCRMLGHASAISHHCCAEFGSGDEYVFEYIRCEGHELSIKECRYRIEEHNFDESMVSVYQCDQSEDVGITCNPAKVRLQGGLNGPTMRDGIVEVFYEHVWTAIYAETMDFNLAIVLCRMLDYHTARSYLDHDQWTRSRDGILNGSFQCTGDEEHFNDCAFVSGMISSSSGVPRVAGVTCLSLPIRLQSSTKANEGKVEVFFGDSWGTVCFNSWGMNEAIVACRMLGYEGASVALRKEGDAYDVIFESVQCEGTEINLAHCNLSDSHSLPNQASSSSISMSSCDDAAGVRCSGEVAVPLRLSGGVDSSEGRVEMFYYGSWGTVCGRYGNLQQYAMNSARVICRMLGYPGALDSKCCGHYGPGVGGVFIAIPACTGKESNILNCRRWYTVLSGCNHFHDFGVACQKNHDLEVRLVGGDKPWEGRVEVLYQDTWGTVCDDNWDLNDANVVCRMLGYERAESYSCCSAFGEGSGDIIFDDVECDGSEDNIGHCARNQLGSHDCTHSEDVGVKCIGLKSGFTAMVTVTTHSNAIADKRVPGPQTWNISADRTLGLTITLVILLLVVNVVILTLSIKIHIYRRRNVTTDTF